MKKTTALIWMPHAGHFICGSSCRFRLNTYVNGYIVSTVGEHVPASRPEHDSFEKIGCDRLYETMVFKAGRNTCECGCGLPRIDGSEVDFAGTNSAKEATANHMRLCYKYAAV